VVKDSHPCFSFHSNSCEMLERCSSISCVAPGWRLKGLLCVTLHFQLNLKFSLLFPLKEKCTCIFVGMSRNVFVCETEALPGLFMASALLFPTKNAKKIVKSITEGKIHAIGTLRILLFAYPLLFFGYYTW